MSAVQSEALSCPLAVDLDGSLIRTDMLHESAIAVCRDHPLLVLRVPFWLLQGKAALKAELSRRFQFDPDVLPYHQDLIAWLRMERAAGRRLILCTASDIKIAERIAGHLDLFDEVIASDGELNLAGQHKADLLERRFGLGGFDYAGNSSADLKVWARARRAILVNTSAGVSRQARQDGFVEREFPRVRPGFVAILKMLRVHQWLKNGLLFIPLLASHQLGRLHLWQELAFAWMAFSLCASAVYIANDLTDLDSDRRHPRKSARPFASGLLPAWVGIAAVPLLLTLSTLLSRQVGGAFMPWLVCYFLLTCAYSWGLKRLVIVDCLTLAILYTLRVIAGAAAIQNTLSFWLLAFSVFLFLSLAFVKRYTELRTHASLGKEKAHGRGYYSEDASLVQTLGVTSGFAAVMVLALYLNSEAVLQLYRLPEAMWAAVPVVLFWISWMWMKAHRGQMHDDPLVFAFKDPASLCAGTVFGCVLALGALGLPW